MKKGMIVFMAIVLFLVSFLTAPLIPLNVYAQSFDAKVLVGVSLGTRVTHRATITDTNDTFTYGSGDTAKLDLSGYKYAIIEVDVGGTTPSWDVTPEFGDATASTYFKGQKRTVTQDERFIVEVDSESIFMVRCDGKSGTTPTIAVYITPFN